MLSNISMKFVKKSHRLADEIFAQEAFVAQYHEIVQIISDISDDDIKRVHLQKYAKQKSLSKAINLLLLERFIAKGWLDEAPIFKGKGYAEESTWRLDFAKADVSIEVGFNHGEAIAWNLIKPVLASEVNNVEKAISTKIGVMICATSELKIAGGFDGAVGTFEKIGSYLVPLNSMLTVPVLIIGLKAPETFKIQHEKNEKGKKVGKIVSL
jgi:hypothetical protein